MFFLFFFFFSFSFSGFDLSVPTTLDILIIQLIINVHFLPIISFDQTGM